MAVRGDRHVRGMYAQPEGFGALRYVVLAVALTLPVAARAQIPPANARCRDALGRGAEKLATAVLRAQAHCHNRRALGSLPATLDCNDPMQSPSLAVIQQAAAKLIGRAQRHCADAPPPAALGYVGCPAPCA